MMNAKAADLLVQHELPQIMGRYDVIMILRSTAARTIANREKFISVLGGSHAISEDDVIWFQHFNLGVQYLSVEIAS